MYVHAQIRVIEKKLKCQRKQLKINIETHRLHLILLIYVDGLVLSCIFFTEEK